jgi:hypothetical protein
MGNRRAASWIPQIMVMTTAYSLLADSNNLRSQPLSANGSAAERPRFSAVRSSRLLASLLGRDELRYGHVATFTQAASVKFDSRDFMKSLGCEVAGSAMGATNDWHLFDHQQSRASSIGSGYWANLNTSATTGLAISFSAVIPHLKTTENRVNRRGVSLRPC